MKRSIFAALAVLGMGLGSVQARAIDSVYLGGQIGHVALSGNAATNFSNAIGFGVELGLEANYLFNLNTRFHYSSHAGGAGLDLYYPTISADFHIVRYSDFGLTLGGGPGFYFFNTGGASETNFGLNVGLDGDVILNDTVRVGLGWRYHGIFGGTVGDNFFTVMMRLGFVFDTDG